MVIDLIHHLCHCYYSTMMIDPHDADILVNITIELLRIQKIQWLFPNKEYCSTTTSYMWLIYNS